MQPHLRTSLITSLRCCHMLLLAAGGLSFWAGGRFLNEVFRMERILAEFLGLGAAVVLIVLGFGAKALAENLDVLP